MHVPQEQAAAQPQVCIFLLQLGGPSNMQAIEPFLRNLFADVLPGPRWLRHAIAWGLAKRRAPSVAPLYKELGGGSPLLANTEAQAQALSRRLAALGIANRVLIAMRFAPPRFAEALATARQEHASVPWIALPLYPQYSFATTQSSLQELQAQLSAGERMQLQVIRDYPTDSLYLDAVAESIQETLRAQKEEVRRNIHLVFSAHGLPLKSVRSGDPYPQQIERSVQGILSRLPEGIAYSLCYQSRVGPVAWLEPSTQHTLERLGKEGVRQVAVVPLSFVSEHLETLHELDIQLRQVATQAGISHYVRVPTVGTRSRFIEALAQQVVRCLRR